METWKGKIKVRLGTVPHTPGYTSIVDVETEGSNFYEEVQFLQRAKFIVEAWNQLYATV